MKLMTAAALILVWAISGLGQSQDVEALVRKVEQQGQEIESLKAQIARIERIVMGTAVITTAAWTEPQQAAPTPQIAGIVSTVPQAAQTAQTPPQLAGFRFSGDFRLRFDAAIRGATPEITGLQNVLQRYRLRFNADRDVASDLSFHLQLATGAINNGLTLDQDFAGGVVRHPFMISEASVDFHPTPNFSVRGGKVEEIYADNTKFLWDDDVRFNGFNERLRIGPVEFRAGQYLFVNPNVFATPATSALTLAGVETGTIARASQMFHQGVTIDGAINDKWRHEATADVQLFRNPNLIALTSNAQGAPATVAPALGVTLASPAPGVGNATVSPSSAILFAPHYQVVRGMYRLDSNGLNGNPRLPLTWMVQAARNVGTSQLRDAMLASISVGRAAQKGDVRGLYAFVIKDANSLISQLTDDNLGTGTGVNIATHYLRLDYTVRPGIAVQNLVFIQNERRSSNPAANFFVPLGRETPRTWRYQGHLLITF